MRYPEGHKEAVRAKIVSHASRALRREGIAGISIPALMKKAGLTHGAFYAHFDDRDALVAAAIDAGADETAATVLSDEAGDLRASLDAYLSAEHVAHPEHGCVLAALGGEGRRQSPIVRTAFARAARGFLHLVDRKLHPKKPKGASPSDDAMSVAARMVGAVVLARLVDDKALAERLLKVAKTP